MSPRPPILDYAAHLAEPTRCRLLRSLGASELAVSELCQVLQLPQSTVSRHLKVLVEGGWLVARREGTRHVYLHAPTLDDAAVRLWQLVDAETSSTAEAHRDQRRLASVLRDRRDRSRDFFAASAADWDRMRDEIFGRRFDLEALLGLLDPRSVVGDLGCGTGRVSEALAPWVDRVIAIDGATTMLDAASTRLEDFESVELRVGELEALPVADSALDAATLVLALHHVPNPADVLAEAHRALRPGGRLLVVDMLPHDREAYRREMGHVWLGFSVEQMKAMLRDGGFEHIRTRALRPDPDVLGPDLFVATASRAETLAGEVA